MSVTANRHVLEADHVPHDHDFVEIAMVSGGGGVHRTIHGDQRISAGDTFLLPPGVWHSYVDCLGLDIYNCCFGPELLKRELAWIAEDPALNYMVPLHPVSVDGSDVLRLRLPEDASTRCRCHFESMIQSSTRWGTHVRRVGHLLLLLGEFSEHGRFDRQVGAGWSQEKHPAVQQCLELLQGNPAHQWTLSELASLLSIDSSYLVRLFKGYAGIPPMKYLARYRAEAAANLLLRTEWEVSRIGIEVGWPDPTYFARRFRTHFGTSPTAYRARLAPETLRQGYP